MKKGLLLAALVIATADGVAYACSCLSTDDPAELREYAAEAAKGAVAIVEADVVTGFRSGHGERMVVRRTLAGRAPSRFQVLRGRSPSGAACDDLYRVGERRTVILYPAKTAKGRLPTYRTPSICTAALLAKPVFRNAVAARIGRTKRG